MQLTATSLLQSTLASAQTLVKAFAEPASASALQLFAFCYLFSLRATDANITKATKGSIYHTHTHTNEVVNNCQLTDFMVLTLAVQIAKPKVKRFDSICFVNGKNLSFVLEFPYVIPIKTKQKLNLTQHPL